MAVAPCSTAVKQQGTVVIPNKTCYVPEVRHVKNRIYGQQTAIVTGLEGEEIYPDKYGRVKVQFFWDRLDQWNEKTTCWIRVSQGWAGPTYGMVAVPRIGHEVIVSFMEGDPDRPIITGRMYHALNMPPYELPDNKTRTVFKSMSTPGEEDEERGFNEFRIEDKKGEEEIYIHAEKDVNIHVKNDWKEHILHDKHETIDASRYTHIKGEDHLIIEKPRKIELKDEDHLIVHQDSHAEYKTKWLAKAGEEIHFKSGDKVVIEAGSDLTIKAGGSFIRLNPAGITIMGSMVKINEGGSPGSGSGAGPASATEAIGVDPSGKPISPEIRKGEEVEEPVLEQQGVTSEMLPQFSDNVIEMINYSPTLSSDICNNPDIKFELGDANAGSYYNPAMSIITIASGQSDIEIVNMMAHEMGHALDPDLNSLDLTNLRHPDNYYTYLNSEGYATIKNIEVRDKIFTATKGQRDIGIADTQGTAYRDVFTRYKNDELSLKDATEKIGSIFCNNERTSTTNQTYGDYYGLVCK